MLRRLINKTFRSDVARCLDSEQIKTPTSDVHHNHSELDMSTGIAHQSQRKMTWLRAGWQTPAQISKEYGIQKNEIRSSSFVISSGKGDEIDPLSLCVCVKCVWTPAGVTAAPAHEACSHPVSQPEQYETQPLLVENWYVLRWRRIRHRKNNNKQLHNQKPNHTTPPAHRITIQWK